MIEKNIKESGNIIPEDVIKQLCAFSTGTYEKFIIVDDLISGKKAVPKIHEKLMSVGKSTLYKYIGDLENAGIIKKETRGSKVFYSLAGFSIVLTPKRISEMLTGAREDEEKRFNEMLKFNGQVSITDRYNRTGEFYPGVLLSDMVSCGIKISTSVDILMDVMENLHDGISTREISSITRRMIEKRSRHLAVDYKKYILGAANIETDEGIELWDDEMVGKVIKQRHDIVDIPAPELEQLSHRIGRHLKRLGKVIPENLALAYIDYIISSYLEVR
ncbi:hypothetical protein BEH94_11535 [Candidatus Altiarchaeales archaeon WOR_SM1_SCG]|nr:hypothetical protein BEH94_11535 [Candidatus Altiarchaeales archaeon WOR_SM1_SCG]